MPRQKLDTTASRALHALETDHQLLHSVEQRAIVLWVLAASAPARRLCERLAEAIVADLRHRPERYDDLYTFALSLNAVYAFDQQLIAGDIQAMLAARLVGAEVMPGGPYAGSDGTVRDDANMQIAYLAATVAHPLPNLAMYYEQMQRWYQVNIQGIPTTDQYIKQAYVVRKSSAEQEDSSSTDKNKQYVYASANKAVVQAAPSLRPRVLSAIASLSTVDKSSEVALLPLMYAQSLQTRPLAMTDTLCCNLGVANIFCWVAYTIFDDFIDAEGIAATMPVAAYAQRTMLEMYMSLSQNADAASLIRDVFNTMDEANSWELNHCRATVDKGQLTITSIPDYGNLRFLYERSLGHALGPLLLQQITDSAHVDLLRQAFCHYLIARQLNDDLHDWAEDLATGQLSYVVISVLRDAGIGIGKHSLDDIMPGLRKVFWQQSVDILTGQILDYCGRARVTLEEVAPLRQNAAILMLVQRLEDSVARSLQIRDNGQQFIEKIRSN